VCVGVTSTVLVEVVVDVVASGVPEGLGISRVVDVSVVVVASFFWQPIVRAPAPRIRKPARVRILFMAILLKKGGPSGRSLTFATSVPHPISNPSARRPWMPSAYPVRLRKIGEELSGRRLDIREHVHRIRLK
jgi:hypothetical protein